MDRDAVAYLVESERLPAQPPGGLNVAHVIRRRRPEPSRLTEAWEWIASGRAQALIVVRLANAAGSLSELVRVLDWLDGYEASLVALEPGLDSAGPEGKVAVGVLREVWSWSRQPELPRRPPGRPGLQHAAPELARRIGLMREQGLSLQGIAQVLNAEGVPTPRGGSEWRPSSVQTALGYRRPPPPPRGPGHPPPPRGPGRTSPGRQPPGPR